MADVINAHWFGGVDKLPPNAVYIGRPSVYGNPYSSKSGKYSREEAVAYHRLHVYRQLRANPSLLAVWRQELGDKDLACWCASKTSVVSCHGDTLSLILSPAKSNRTYEKHPLVYLMDDVRTALANIKRRVVKTMTDEQFKRFHVVVDELCLEISFLLIVLKRWSLDPDSMCDYIAPVAICAELIHRETDMERFKYRLDHLFWRIQGMVYKTDNSASEPKPPVLRKKTK